LTPECQEACKFVFSPVNSGIFTMNAPKMLFSTVSRLDHLQLLLDKVLRAWNWVYFFTNKKLFTVAAYELTRPLGLCSTGLLCQRKSTTTLQLPLASNHLLLLL